MKMSLLEFLQIRQELFKYLQVKKKQKNQYLICFKDKIIRVSVFLQENIQNNDGSIIISNKGMGGVFVQTPGIIV